MERTWLCRNERADASTITSSPWRSTSSRSSVFTGDLAWHSVERKVVKSCLPTRRCAAACIAAASSGRGTRQAWPQIEREIGAAVEDAVAIMALARRGARVEVVGHPLGRQHGDRMRAQVGIERVAHGVGVPVARQIDMRHLGARMHAGIGAPGALHQGLLARQRFDRRGQHALHGHLVGLDLPAGKRGCRHIRWSACSGARLIHLKSAGRRALYK